MVEHLKYCLHQLILRGYELLHLWVLVAIVGLVVAGLATALAIPCVHHLRDFLEERYKFSKIGSKHQLYTVIFINLD
jgi:uncharacterized membrane protein YesL